MSELERDFVVEGENEAVEEIAEEKESFTLETVPVSRLMVGMAENIIAMMVKDPEKRQELMLMYEKNTIPVMDLIKFDEAFTRKFLAGKGLNDEAIVTFGIGYFAVQTIGTAIMAITINKRMKNQEVNDNEGNNNERQEGENREATGTVR